MSQPEIIGISSRANYSEWGRVAYELDVPNRIFLNKFYGMVGAVMDGKVVMCGGIIFGNKSSTMTTKSCHALVFQSYFWKQLNVAMISARSFAQSIVLENGTFFVMGGEAAEFGDIFYTTEFLDSITSEFFQNGIVMPERLTKHCASKINSSHLFLSGGLQDTAISRGRCQIFSSNFEKNTPYQSAHV